MDPRTSTWDVVILGGGPAGLGAAVYSTTEGLRTLVVEPAVLGGQAAQSARIDNYLGFPQGISGKQLTDKAIKQVKKYGGVIRSEQVDALGRQGDMQLVQMRGGDIVEGRAVLVAIGVQYRRLEVPGINTFGVFYGADPHGAKQWTGKEIAVVGGANSAGQCAYHYSMFCKHVNLLVREAEGIDKGMSAYLIERVRSCENVHIRQGVVIERVVGKGNCLTLHLSDQDTLDVDGVFLFIGADPHTGWLINMGIECDDKGFIRTGFSLSEEVKEERRVLLPHETSRRGVFAIGDVRKGTVKRVASAVGDGAAVVSEVHQYLESITW